MTKKDNFKENMMDYLSTTIIGNLFYDLTDIKEELHAESIIIRYDAENENIVITIDNNIYILNMIKLGADKIC